MKKVSEAKSTRVRADSNSVRVADRVRVVRVAGSSGRTVRWHVSRPDTKK
jgi:hypothetical protein